ncbi:MAG: response regulator [Bacteroidetes bacterium]|nr:response regulator [Bacteroidota bacterium]MBT6687531.1 response regulator [Bacteroidota bacterium]MBT7142762.1 response regulator [Bacteroidota bacterium]MBT7491965.1 response regulator [Bacteroidota bacterium]
MKYCETKILLIEDNPNDIKLANRAFKKNNLLDHVKIISDGEESLDYIFCNGNYTENINHKLQLILLDLKLPKVDGLSILQELKSNEKTKSIPIVILTSSCEEKDLIDAYRLGANSYIIKPMKFEDFVRLISNLRKYWLSLNELPIVLGEN